MEPTSITMSFARPQHNARRHRTVLITSLVVASLLAVSPILADDLVLPDSLTSENQVDVREQPAAPAPKLPPIENKRPLADVGPKDVLYESAGQIVTRSDWEDRIRLAPPYYAQIHGQLEVTFDRLPAMNYVRSIEQTVLDETAAAKARELGLELSEEARRQLDEDRLDVEYRLWLLKTGVAKGIEPTPEEMKAFYEEHADEYMDSSQLTLKTIFATTYKTYTVVEGDTLESLAERFPSPPEVGSEILHITTRQPRQETIAQQPLVPGEELLVPVDADAAAQAEERILEAAARLAAGEPFDEVAKQYSTNPNSTIIVRPEEDKRPINPAVRDVFMALADGAISEPFRTRHGWQVIQRVGYTPPKPKPIESLSLTLFERMRTERLSKQWTAYLEELWNKQSIFTVDQGALAQAHLPEAADMVVVTGPDFSMTAAQFREAAGDELKADTLQADRLKMVRHLDPIELRLGKDDSKAMGITEDPLYKLAAELLEQRLLAEAYINHRAAESVPAPSGTEVRLEFERRKTDFNRTPSAEVWQLSVPLDFAGIVDPVAQNKLSREMVQKLAADLKEVENLEQFTAKVDELSADEHKASQGRVGVVNKYTRQGLFARAIESKPNTLYGPVPVDGRLYAWWIGNKWETAEVAFADVRDLVEADMKAKAGENQKQVVRDQLLAGSELRLHFDPMAGTSTP